jgi:hypothetical protein
VAADAGVVVAHGGLAGALVEAAIVLALVGVLVWVWLRERRADREDDLSEPEEDGSHPE